MPLQIDRTNARRPRIQYISVRNRKRSHTGSVSNVRRSRSSHLVHHTTIFDRCWVDIRNNPSRHVQYAAHSKVIASFASILLRGHRIHLHTVFPFGPSHVTHLETTKSCVFDGRRSRQLRKVAILCLWCVSISSVSFTMRSEYHLHYDQLWTYTNLNTLNHLRCPSI